MRLPPDLFDLRESRLATPDRASAEQTLEEFGDSFRHQLALAWAEGYDEGYKQAARDIAGQLHKASLAPRGVFDETFRQH